MTRTALEISLAIGLSAALALPTVLLSSEAKAEGPGDGTDAPIIVVTPAPAPTPPPPPPPVYQTAVPGSMAPSPMIVNPRIAALKQQRNSGLGMTISGYTMFGTSYLISALVGTISLDYAADVGGTGTYGRRMLIPIAGPFMAIPRADSATGGLFTGFLGVVQIGGFVLGTAGAIKFGRANRQLRLSADTGGLKLQF
ncbi:hypothetical protein [Enhygromyxa salina]|uniref:Uncharacterized protein n=1 Tax=Enhygromyxa salina TaxID=215803 RepID=A0A2S9YRG3_9BACT|nr:hypothetical protein [Enhygromyxa salina]PRQ07670.1 hypothetical protein ENSA7_26600 [Enhygromyxa salina]